MINVILTGVLERAVNLIFSLNQTKTHFQERHFGKVIKLELKETATSFFFLIRKEKIFVQKYYDAAPDTIIKGSVPSYLKNLLPFNQITTLQVEGDLELAHQFKLLLQDIDIDSEEYLSYLTGDVIAKQLTQIWHNFYETCHSNVKRTSEDLIEFIQEEKQLLPTQEEVEDFFEETRKLKMDIERFEMRLTRLRKKL